MAQFDSNTELVRSGQSNMIQRNMSEQARSNALSEWIAEQRKKRQEEQTAQQEQWNNIVDLGPAPEPEQEEEQPFVPPSYEEPEEETTPIIQPPVQQTTELHPDREYHEWTPPETEQSSAPLVVPRTREDQTKTNVPTPATPAETYNEWEEFLNQQELDQETDDQVSRTLEPQDQSVLGNGYVQPVAAGNMTAPAHRQYRASDVESQWFGQNENTALSDENIESMVQDVNTHNAQFAQVDPATGLLYDPEVEAYYIPNGSGGYNFLTTDTLENTLNYMNNLGMIIDDPRERIIAASNLAETGNIPESMLYRHNAEKLDDYDMRGREAVMGQNTRDRIARASGYDNYDEMIYDLIGKSEQQILVENNPTYRFWDTLMGLGATPAYGEDVSGETPQTTTQNARPEVDINALAEARRNNYDVQQPTNSYDRYNETYGPNNEEWETFVRMYEDRGYSREQAMEMATAEVYNPEIEYHPDREYYGFTPTVNSPETETGPGVWEPIGNASQEIVSDYDRAIEDAAGAIGAFIINNSGQSAELARQNAIAEMMFADGISPDRIMMNDPLWNRYEERFNEMYPNGIEVANSTITPEYFTEKADRKINEFGTSIEEALEPAIESASHEIGRQNEAVEEAEKLGIEAGSKEFYDFVDNYQTIADRNEEENLRRARERQTQDLIDSLVETGVPERQAERMVENPEKYGWNYETGRPTLLKPNEQALQQSYWDNIVDSYGWNKTPGQRLMDNYMQMDAPAETPDGLNTAAQALFTDGLTKDQKLHLFDKGGTFFSPDSGVIIRPEFADLIATDPAHAAGSKATDLIQTVNLTDEQYYKMFQAFLDANPIIKQMYDQGILTYDDIANNFFKNVAYGAGTGSGTGSGTYGYGGYAPRYYGGGGGYGYGYSGGSSRKSTGWIDQSQAVAKKQQEQRINNIMKNWTF